MSYGPISVKNLGYWLQATVLTALISLLWTSSASCQQSLWTPQQGGIGGGSVSGPSLTVFQSRLYAVWNGANGDQRMFWSSFDGQTWAPQQVGIGGGSSGRPSLAVFQNRLYAAWKGANGDQRMFWSSFDGHTWAPQQVGIGGGSTSGPSLAVFQNRLYAAWNGANGDQHMFWSSFDGQTWAPQQVGIGGGSSGRPSLAVFQTGLTNSDLRLFAGWKGGGADQRMFWSSFDGAQWAPQQVGIGGGSSTGPSLAMFQNRIYAAWTGANGDERMFWSSFDVDRQTVVLRVSGWNENNTIRSFSDTPVIGTFIGHGIDCSHGGAGPRNASPPSGPGVFGDAGWGQVEVSNSDSCVSWVRRFAFDFDIQPFTSFPGLKQLERVVLRYNENETPDCFALVFTQGGFLVDTLACWTNGNGDREEKPEGCLFLRVPSVDWGTLPDDRPKSLLDVTFRKIGPRGRWDVTDLFRRRVMPGLESPPQAGGPAPRGWGFALVGAFTDTDHLDARDNTRCTSHVTDLALEVTFVVIPAPPNPGPPEIIR